jgi:hypothetical protein
MVRDALQLTIPTIAESNPEGFTRTHHLDQCHVREWALQL